MNIHTSFQPDAEVVIYPGDCLDLLADIPSESVDLVVTSPPYNLGKPYETRLDLDVYIDQQRRVIEECIRVLKPSGSVCWQVGNYVTDGQVLPLDIKLYPLFEAGGIQLRNRIVWHFGHGLHASHRFSGRYEVVLWFTKSKDYYFDLDPVRVPQKYPNKKHFKGPRRGQRSGNPLGKNPSDIWEIPNVKANHVEKTDHPCQFPVELIERLVLALTPERGLVLDPFLGVGTTAIAALMHGRRVLGAEIESYYVEIATERLRDAERGSLRIRPMRRAVYDPRNPQDSVPPQTVCIPSTAYEAGRLLENSPQYAKSARQQ